jgi:DNA-binding XRE family transcriptional regulator
MVISLLSGSWSCVKQRYALSSPYMRKTTSPKKPHVIAWLREQLGGITQAQLAKRIKVTTATIRAAERGRVSEKLAFKLAAHSGIHHEFFLDNILEKPFANLKDLEFERRLYSMPAYYHAYLSQRVDLMRGYLFDRMLANELGPVGCEASGFNKALDESLWRHWECIEPKHRDFLLRKGKTAVPKDAEAIARLVLRDAQGILRAIQEDKRNRRALNPPPAPAGDGRGRSSALPSPQGNGRRSS